MMDSSSLELFGLRPDLAIVEVRSRREWREWLTKEHARPTGVWVVTAKKGSLGSLDEFVSARDINEECLCFAWIDSKPGRVDDQRTALLCTPRKPSSGWSLVNKKRIEDLIAKGQMSSVGMHAIEAAKANGSWVLLDSADALEIPDDLQRELNQYDQAATYFNTFPPSSRRATLEWISQAKTESTRRKRIEETARLAQDNLRANQWRRPDKA